MTQKRVNNNYQSRLSKKCSKEEEENLTDRDRVDVSCQGQCGNQVQ